MALTLSVLYRHHAIPVAWPSVAAQAQGSWIPPLCPLLRWLAAAVPVTVPVHVLCDQGINSRVLWDPIVALGWHPCLRHQAHITFRPEGEATRAR